MSLHRARRGRGGCQWAGSIAAGGRRGRTKARRRRVRARGEVRSVPAGCVPVGHRAPSSSRRRRR